MKSEILSPYQSIILPVTSPIDYSPLGFSPLNFKTPTQENWQRWRPTIVERYRSMPARIFLEEMKAEGLHVTMKMLRDKFRAWEINDKNTRRKLGRHGDPASRSRPAQQRVCIQNDTIYDTTLVRLPQCSPSRAFNTPREEVPSSTMISTLMPYMHERDCDDTMKNLRRSAGMRCQTGVHFRITSCLNHIEAQIKLLEGGRLSVPPLNKRLLQHINALEQALAQAKISEIHPVDLLDSIDRLSLFAARLDTQFQPWRTATLSFLLRVISNHFGSSHPVPLFWRAILTEDPTLDTATKLTKMSTTFSRTYYLDKSDELRGRSMMVRALLERNHKAELREYQRYLLRDAAYHHMQLRPDDLLDIAVSAMNLGISELAQDCIQWATEKLHAITQHSSTNERWSALASWRYLDDIVATRSGIARTDLALLEAIKFADSLGVDADDHFADAVDDLLGLYEDNNDTEKKEALLAQFPGIASIYKVPDSDNNDVIAWVGGWLVPSQM